MTRELLDAAIEAYMATEGVQSTIHELSAWLLTLSHATNQDVKFEHPVYGVLETTRYEVKPK